MKKQRRLLAYTQLYTGKRISDSLIFLRLESVCLLLG